MGTNTARNHVCWEPSLRQSSGLKGSQVVKAPQGATCPPHWGEATAHETLTLIFHVGLAVWGGGDAEMPFSCGILRSLEIQ